MKRLIDDPQIAGELRAEMQRYAAEQAEVDLKRAYASLEASLPLTAAASTSAPRERTAGGRWSALSGTTKLLIIAAIGGTSALGFAGLRGVAPPIAQSTPAPVLPSTAAEQADSSSPMNAAHPQPGPLGASQPSTALPAEASTTAPSGSSQAAASTASRGRNSGASSASRREIAQLARIKSLLEQDPAAARRLIKAAQREFPEGLLVEEREGLDAIALFALSRKERARAQAERFIARYPQSPLRPKLERLIADARE